MKNAKSQPKVVIDTNVWVSGLIFGGLPENVIRLFLDQIVEVAISEELLTELKRIITHKFPYFVYRLRSLEAAISEDAEIVKLGDQTVNVCRDPDDNRVIETALIGNCAYIISGDKDLLELKSYQDIQIIKPAAFLKKIGR